METPFQFWHDEKPVPSGEELLAEFLSEHSADLGWDSGELVIAFGGKCAGDCSTDDTFTEGCCMFCETPIRRGMDSGWRHLWSYQDRAGCGVAWPRSIIQAA